MIFLAVGLDKTEWVVLSEFQQYKFGILFSAGRLWNGSRMKSLTLHQLLRHFKSRPVYLDSGAQQFVSKLHGYPKQYKLEYYRVAKYLREQDYVASLDVPLDVVLGPKGEKWDINIARKCIEETVNNAIELFELYERGELKATPVLILQGHEKEPNLYLECLDMFKEQGLLKHQYIGIGGLCMATPTGVVKVSMMVRKRLSEHWIHVFGPDRRIWRKLKLYVNSWDTSMWHAIRPYSIKTNFGYLIRPAYHPNNPKNSARKREYRNYYEFLRNELESFFERYGAFFK